MAQPTKLTKSFIDHIKPDARDTIHWDTETKGFGLKVTPSGRMVFVVMHRPKGHTGAAKKYTIGKYGEWTLQQAREKAREVLHESAQGIDRGARQRAANARTSTDEVGCLASLFFDKHASHNKTHAETQRIMNHDVLPEIGKKSVHNVSKHDVIAIIDRVADRGSPVMANRTLAAIRKFLNWCVSRGLIDASPAQGVVAPSKEKSRDRVLTEDETRSILTASKQMAYPFGTIVQLLFLTAQRRDEVAHMRWSEIDFDKRLWTIPATRAKNGKAHDVHLAQSAFDLLSSIPRFASAGGEECDLVFTTNGKTSVSGFSKAKLKLDELSDAIGWRLHDIRRTVVTGMSQMGVPVHVADAILNHKSGTISGVTAVYQRNAFTKERRDALDQWDERLQELLHGIADA